MNKQPRISKFWLNGGYLSTPPASAPVLPGEHYVYGLERAPDGTATAHRFASLSDRELWIAMGAPGTREKCRARHPAVRYANNYDRWPETDEDLE